MKVSEMRDDTIVELYIQLRDRRAARKAAYENEDAQDKEKMNKFEQLLLDRFRANGLKSISTDLGTAYTKHTVSATVADRAMWFDWILEAPTERVVFLTTHVAKDEVVQFKEANNDLPPGINWSESLSVGVRRS